MVKQKPTKPEQEKFEVPTRTPRKPGIFDSVGTNRQTGPHPVIEMLDGLPSASSPTSQTAETPEVATEIVSHPSTTGDTSPSSTSSDTSQTSPASVTSPTSDASPTTPTSATRTTRRIDKKETAPVRDFSKVANSITRGISDGLFKPGKSKQCYDVLYSLTRGAIVPRRTFRMSKPNLMKAMGIGSRITLDSILTDFKAKGLIMERQIIGEREGNEYEVFTPDEITEIVSEASRTSTTGTSSGTNSTENLQGLVPLGSTLTSAGPSSMDADTWDEIKTLLKTFKSDDDKQLLISALAKLNEAAKTATGKSLAKPDWQAFEAIIDMVIDETTAAGTRTNGISVYLKFAEANLRRRLYVSPVPRSDSGRTRRNSKEPLPVEFFISADNGEFVDDEEIEKFAIEYLALIEAQTANGLAAISITDVESAKWQEIVQGLKQRLNKDVFNTWFRPVLCEGFNLKTESLTLRCGQITADWIRMYYSELIAEVAQEIGFQNLQVSWTIVPENGSIEEFQRRFTDGTWVKIFDKASVLKGAGN